MKRARLILFIILSILVLAPSPAPARGLPDIFEALEESGGKDGIVEELDKFVRENPGAPALDEALLRLARIYVERKDFDKAASMYQKLLEDHPESRYKFDALYELGVLRARTGRVKEARALLLPVAEVQGTSLDLRAKAVKALKGMESLAEAGSFGAPAAVAIGVILPLKGQYSAYAEDALNGVLLAASVFGKADGAGVEVVVKDVGTDPASVETAVSDLAHDGRVAGIVGPLLSSTAIEAGKHAQARRIPVVTLSQKEGVTDAGDYVFRNFMTPAQQAAAIAEHAVKTLGLKRFAVLYPQNNYGTELARLFEMNVKALGAESVRTGSYPEGHTDFSAELKRLFVVQEKERKEGRRQIKEYKPTASIEALYIPDSPQAVALITPYLEYFSVKGVQLLGANGWNSERLVELGGANVEGAVFVDGFFSGSLRPGTEEFVKRFTEAYGKTPGVLEAHAYDAAMMLISAMPDKRDDMEGPSIDRGSIKARLKNLRFKGAAGALAFDERGEAKKKLFILTVKDGRIVEVN
ncbi:MAG: penicillin-binding protein activator [Deltaproteobacteria bacterium]|nr:penicillin-binding protein activator [Deltaproteobacteria bacterium]